MIFPEPEVKLALFLVQKQMGEIQGDIRDLQNSNNEGGRREEKIIYILCQFLDRIERLELAHRREKQIAQKEIRKMNKKFNLLVLTCGVAFATLTLFTVLYK